MIHTDNALTGLFATRLRQMRGQRGLSQQGLAGLAHINETQLSHFETGSRAPSLANLCKLAEALDVSTDYLCGRTAMPWRTYTPSSRVAYIADRCERMSRPAFAALVALAGVLAKETDSPTDSFHA